MLSLIGYLSPAIVLAVFLAILWYYIEEKPRKERKRKESLEEFIAGLDELELDKIKKKLEPIKHYKESYSNNFCWSCGGKLVEYECGGNFDQKTGQKHIWIGKTCSKFWCR